MAQFDVHRNSAPRRGSIPYVVVVQSGRFDVTGRRVVVPLIAQSGLTSSDPRLTPEFELEGQTVVLNPLLVVSIAASRLGKHVGSLKSHGDRIIAAIDLVLSRAWG